MPNVDDVQFDEAGWQQVEKKDHIQVWADDIKNLTAVLSVELFTGRPEIAVSLEEINKIRFLYRDIANQSGAGLISADVIDVDGIGGIQTIFKLPQPNRGYVYVGSITVPFAEFSYVVKIQCIEKGYIGLREAVILDQLFDEGHEVDDMTGLLKGWEKDPYAPDAVFPLMPNLAEDEKYDEDFPLHALSRVRETLRKIAASLTFSALVHNAEPFTPEA